MLEEKMFYRIKRQKGKTGQIYRYLYQEERIRVPGRKNPKSKSKCLGPVGTLLSNIFSAPNLGERAEGRAASDIEQHGKLMAAIDEEWSRNQTVWDEKMYAAYGMKPAVANPTPVEKTSASAPPAPSFQSQTAAPASAPSSEPGHQGGPFVAE